MAKKIPNKLEKLGPQRETDMWGYDCMIWRNHQGQYHRLDGPAYTNSCGVRAWYLNGRRHRTDGPAICHPDGTQDWYFNGEYMTPQIEEWMAVRQVTWPWDESTQVEFALTLVYAECRTNSLS